VVEYCESIVNKSQMLIGVLILMLNISRSKYYKWKQRVGTVNRHNGQQPKQHWTLPEERQAIIDYARRHINSLQYYLNDGYRRITYMGIDENVFAFSPMTAYRILKRVGMLSKWKNKKRSISKGTGFKQPTEPQQEWHTDIKFVNYRGTFLFFIGVMDGYSRYIVHHELRVSMTEKDVEIVLQRALEKYPGKKPRLISDNGSQYISNDFREYLKEAGLQHVKTSRSYPQSNGKIERYHKSMEEECLRTSSMINLEDAREQVARYVDHYNNKRLHSSLFYLRPVDFLNGNVDELLKARQDKLDKATENRRKYWEAKKNVA